MMSSVIAMERACTMISLERSRQGSVVETIVLSFDVIILVVCLFMLPILLGLIDPSLYFRVNMVLGVLTSVAACPAIVGVNEAIQSSQKSQAKQRHRGRKMNLVVSCTDPSSRMSRYINGSYVVLKDRKVCTTCI